MEELEEQRISILLLLSIPDEKDLLSFSIKDFKYFHSIIEYENKKIVFCEVNVSENNEKIRDIPILIGEKEYIIKSFEVKYKKNFIFQKQMTYFNKLYNINNLEIEDELKIYYLMLKKNNSYNEEYFTCLTNEILDILENRNDSSTLSLYLIIYTMNFDILNFRRVKNCLKLIKSIGNINKVDKTKLEDIEMLILYRMFKDFKSLLNDNLSNVMINLIFDYLYNYPNLKELLNITDYISELIEISPTSKIILSTLKYIEDINTFIEIINKKKQKITNLLKIGNDKIILNDFFDLNNLSYENCNELFYANLYSIKSMEKEKFKFLSFNYSLDDILVSNNKTIKLKKLIIYYLIKGLNTKKEEEIVNEMFDNLKSYMIKENFILFSNTEIIILGEIISKVGFNESNSLKFLFELIDFDKIIDEFNDIFKIIKINWFYIFENKIFFINVISKKISSLEILHKMGFLLDLLNTLEKCTENKVDSINYIIETTLNIIQSKYIEHFQTNKDKLNKKDIKVISKIVYLCDKYGKFCSLLYIDNSDYVEEFLVNTFQNYTLSFEFIEIRIFKHLIEKEKFKIIDVLIKEKIDHTKKILNSYILKYEDIFEENDSLRYKLLKFFIDKNYFFTSPCITNYSRETLKILNDIIDKIINMNKISYNEMKLFIKNKKRIESFSLILNKTNIIEICNKNIAAIEELMNNYNDIIKNLETIKLSEFQPVKEKIKAFIVLIKKKKFDSFKEIEYYKLNENIFKKLVNQFCQKVFDETFISFFSKSIEIEIHSKKIDSKLICILYLLFSRNINVDYNYEEYVLNIFLSFIQLDKSKKNIFLKSSYIVFKIIINILQFDFLKKENTKLIEEQRDLEKMIAKEKNEDDDKIFDEKYYNEIKYNIGIVVIKNKIYEKIYKQYLSIITELFNIPQNLINKKKEFSSKSLYLFLDSLEIDNNQLIINNPKLKSKFVEREEQKEDKKEIINKNNENINIDEIDGGSDEGEEENDDLENEKEINESDGGKENKKEEIKKKNNDDNNKEILLRNMDYSTSEEKIKKLFTQIIQEKSEDIENLLIKISQTKFIEIINKLYNNNASLKFLLSISTVDCINMQEFAGEIYGGNNQNFLSLKDLRFIEKLVEIFERIKNYDYIYKSDDKNIILFLRKELEPEEKNLTDYINNYNKYEQFFNENLNKNKYVSETIQKILNNSEFILLNNDIEFFNGFILSDENNEFTNINYEYLLFLRNRAITNRYKKIDYNNKFKNNIDENEEILIENNKIFIEYVHQINELIKLLKKFIKKGISYTFDKFNEINKDNIYLYLNQIENNFFLIKIKIIIEKNNGNYISSFILNKEEKRNYDEINLYIKNLYKSIDTIQKKAYFEKDFINFIYGNQFQMIFDYLLTKKIDEKIDDNLNYFLISLFDNENLKINKKNNLKINANNKFSLNIYENLIDESDKLLRDILKSNNLSLDKIYEKNLMKNEFDKYIGIYINGCINIEKEVIQYFKYFTNNLPLASTLLNCNENTTSEEISSFIYRSILCKQHIYFCIARTELLSKENKTFFINLLKDIFKSEYKSNKPKKMKSCLFIMTQNLEDELCKSLFNSRFIKVLENIKEIKNEKIEDKNLNIVFSDFSGVGKSTFIKNKKKNEYIYFPIGGSFTKEEILKRLKNIDKEKSINKKNDLLFHIDLYDTEQKNLMNDFLYFVLVTKTFAKDNNIFYLSRKIKIYLEIPNSFTNFFEKFPILTLIDDKNKKSIELNNLPKMIISDDIFSNERIVSLFLKLLNEKNKIKKGLQPILKANNKIDKNEIIFPNFNEELVLKDENFNYEDIVIKAVDENKELTPEKCENLIIETIKNCKIDRPNYYQINTFIKVLASQLFLFAKNCYLSICTLIDNNKFKYCKVRSLIIKKFIDLTCYFTKGAYSELIKEQDLIQNLRQKRLEEKEIIQYANDKLENYQHETISFDKMDLALVFFHTGDNRVCFSIITNEKLDANIYNELLELKNSQLLPTENKLLKLPDYKKYSQEDFLIELKSILSIKNPISSKENKEKKIEGINLVKVEQNEKEEKQLKPLEEIAKDYYFTADNFIKMCLILIRIRANVPIIMMGETGCGKTSLIKKLSELQNNGNCHLIIDNIHAGHTNKDIINFIEEKVLPESKKLALEEEKRKKNYKLGTGFEEKKLLVFFDELNTCNSMDLLSEIICKHTYEGKILPENIVFLGAANPYRKAEKKKVGLKIKNVDYYQFSDLVYSVNPMPHSLLSYVFDFGNVKTEDEKNYIEKMIEGKIDNKELKEFCTNLITKAQIFVRNNYGISSVSLREIMRFRELYDFFLDYFDKKKKIINKNIDRNYYLLITEKKEILSINLSLYLVYYLRLSDSINQKSLRKKLSEELNPIFQSMIPNDILDIPLKEQNFIADNVNLDKDIARSRSLLENLFSLFVSINKKIPLFLIGKPGSSKSLSIQIMNNAMRGKTSKSKFFQMYPKMYLITYQGALNSTSEGVERIFNKAREILNTHDNKEIISTILFDEMGLAEHSIHNPLKVIHSNLDDDLNKDNNKISFIGVSNWELDSSKMNRGTTIRIPEPNLDDIKTLSVTIAKSFLGENLEENIEIFFNNLGLSYFKYKEEFKNDNRIKEYEDFHGNRDFFHLIKYSAAKIQEKKNKGNIDNNYLLNLAIDSFERNFGGLELDNGQTGFNIIKEKFYEYSNQDRINKFDIDVKNKIIENLKDFSKDYLSRYLLLITKSNIGIYLLTLFLKSSCEEINYTVFIGSVFKDDIEKEEYTTKVLNKIKLKIEKKHILILKNLDSIYTSLYDLFNQNFVEIQGKKYARIALGSSTNASSEVDEQFRCIIIVDENKIKEQEIPFLNRFEKQNLSFKFIMKEKEISEAEELYEKCKNIIKYDKERFKLINYNITNLLINCDYEEICGIIYANKDNKNFNGFESLLAKKISATLPQDIALILLLNKNEWKNSQKDKRFYELLLDEYNKKSYNNIESFLNEYKIEENNNKIVIYTFTNIIHNIEIKNLYKCEEIKEIRISSIKNEIILETEIEEFLSDKRNKLCIIKFLPFEYFIIDYLKAIIENKEEEFCDKSNKKENKIFIFLVHLERENDSKENNLNSRKRLIGSLSNLSNYKQIFIDDINGEDFLDNKGKIITLNKIYEMNNLDLYRTFINKGTIFLENIYSIICLLGYNFYNNNEKIDFNKDNYSDMIIKLFEKDKFLIECLDKCIMNNLEKKKENENIHENFLEKMIKEEKFSRGDTNIFDIIKNMLVRNYKNEFKSFYIELEKNYFFSSLLKRRHYYTNNDKDDNNKEEQKYYEEFNDAITEIFIEQCYNKNQIYEYENINIYFDYNLPSKNLIKIIHDLIQKEIVEKYLINENTFRNISPEDEDEYKRENEQYENNLILINDYFNKKFYNNEIIKKIQCKSVGIRVKFYNLLFEDYLSYLVNQIFEDKEFNVKEDIKLFLKIIIKNKFHNEKEKNNDLDSISRKLIWLEAYYIEYITPIINFLLLLKALNIDNILNIIESLMKDENFSALVEIKNMKENEKKLNFVFYIIISSLLNIFFLNIGNIISNIKEIELLKNLENNLVINLEAIKVINNQLNLNCKYVFLFEEFVKMIKYILFEVSNNDLEVKKQLILYFLKINKNAKENFKEKKDFHINQYLDKYKNIFTNNKTQNSEEILSFILIEEYRREPNEKNKEYLLKLILDNENIFQNNISFIMEIIYNPLKKFLFENIDILVDISLIEGSFTLLNESKKIEKTIIKIFDLLINIYYDSINDFNIFTTKLFDVFKSYLKTLTDEKYDNYYAENNNDNLLKLFSLSFIKIYLIKFVLLITENKNILKGIENNIIQEIDYTKSFKNTLFTYIIILIFNHFNKDENELNKFLSENLKEVFKFYNEIKDNLDKTEFNKIFELLKIPKANNYPFSEYFNEIDFPNVDKFKEEFLSLNINKEKYPLLWHFIKSENLKKLKHLLDYNDFVETMINNYSGKISRKEAKNICINEIEIYKDNNFLEKLTKFIKIYNQILFDKEGDKLSQRDKLICFLIDDDEKNDYGIKIKKGYDKFINWQNSFINSIVKSEQNKHFKHYLPILKLEIDIQKSKKFQTILIDDNFAKTNFIDFRGLITLYSKRIENNNINKFEYDYDKIEEELAKIILPNKLLFSEKNFYFMIYQFEGSNINNDYLINFENKYGSKKLDEDDKKKLFKYFENNYKFYSIFDEQFIILINYLSNKSSMKKDTLIFDCISDAKKKNINFNSNFTDFFSKEGKEITIEKLLECINVMEILCFDKLRKEINDKYKIDFDKTKEEKINNYFEKEHKDKIITKNEIAIALRRFILKIILDEKKEDKISSISLYKNLYRKDLWNFKIFEVYKDENDFKQRIKEYLEKFSLETNDCLAFYNIIGKNELDKLEKDKQNYGSVEEVKQDNLVIIVNNNNDNDNDNGNKKKMKKKKKKEKEEKNEQEEK